MDLKWFLHSFVALFCMITYSAYGFELTILHTNDIHGRIEETNKYSARCSNSSASKGQCYGGMERLKSKIDELRAKYPNTILLDAGDQYQGSLFFYVYGGQIMAHFMNVLGYDAMALGNHEFDRGPAGIVPLLDNATYPILSCNIDVSGIPELARIRKSVVLDVNGESVGIVGYTTSTTPSISSPGKVKFMDEITSVQKEVDKLISKGVNKIIALGHAGYTKDMEIAKGVRGLDIIVGGHTNTFLYTGDEPSNEKPLGPYPTNIKDIDGKEVLVVQDYAYGKYLGFLQVDFDNKGAVQSWKGNPILMDNTVPKNTTVTELIKAYMPGVEKMKKEKVGESYVLLEGDVTACRVRECNMGNLITDAMIRQNLRHSDSEEWNHVAIAIFQGGGIRSTIEKGDIMTSDVLDVLPFGNTLDLVELPGNILWGALEHSATYWVDKGSYFGGFMQMSGMRVVYNMKREVGNRVVKAEVRCADCDVPMFQPLNMTKMYKVLMPSFTVGGGDGYTMIRDNVGNSHIIGDVDSELLLDYLKSNSPVTKGLEGRIRFEEDSKIDCANGAQITQAWISVLISTIMITVSFLH